MTFLALMCSFMEMVYRPWGNRLRIHQVLGQGSCGGGGAPRDSAGSGATEEGLASREGRM